MSPPVASISSTEQKKGRGRPRKQSSFVDADAHAIDAHEGEEPGGTDEAGAHVVDPLPLAPTPQDLTGAMLELLQLLTRDKRSKPFMYPVDLAEAPGYEDVVSTPMDLSTVRSRVSSGVYGSDIFEFARDVRLIWANCMAYNMPDSAFYNQAKALKTLFDQLYNAKFKQILQRGRRKGQAPTDTAPPQEAPDTKKIDAHVDPRLLKRLKKFVRAMYAHERSGPFQFPVDVSQAPGYLDVVSRPMDLSSIKKQLTSYATGSAADAQRCLDDVLLIFANCQAYNIEGSDLYVSADILKEYAQSTFFGMVKDVVSSPREHGNGPSTKRSSTTAAEKDDDTNTDAPKKKRARVEKVGKGEVQASVRPSDKANRILESLTEFVRAMYAHARSGPFQFPVDVSQAPGYLDVVSRPMDLSSIKKQLTSYATGSAADAQRCLDDVLLIFANCQAYNIEGSDLYVSADILKEYAQSTFAAVVPSHLFESPQSDKTERGNVKVSSKATPGDDVKSSRVYKCLKKFVKSLYQHERSGPFQYPVDVSQAPGYLDVVSRPMDLSSIKKQLTSYATGSAADAQRCLDDVLLIFANCQAYNIEGSDLYVSADILKEYALSTFSQFVPAKLFKVKKKKLSSSRDAGPADNDYSDATTATAAPPSNSKKIAKKLKRSNSPPVVVENMDESVYKRLKKFLKSVYSHPLATPFHYPVDVEELPGYLEVVSRPLDLSYMKKHLAEYATGLAQDVQRCLQDVLLIFDNCQKYYGSGSEMYGNADQLAISVISSFEELFPAKFLQRLQRRSNQHLDNDMLATAVLGSLKDQVMVKKMESAVATDLPDVASAPPMSTELVDSLKLAEKNSHSLFDNEISALNYEDLMKLHSDLHSDRAVHCPLVREKAHNNSKKFLRHFLAGKSTSELYVCGNLGEIETVDTTKFHNSEYIFPVGYSCKRTLILSVVPTAPGGRNMTNESMEEADSTVATRCSSKGAPSADSLVNPVEYPHVEVVFNTTIGKDNEGHDPQIQITAGEDIIVTESTVSPGDAWKTALQEGKHIITALGRKLARCRAVLNRLCVLPIIMPFLEEVPLTGVAGTAYYRVIKSPMWLREVHRRLVEGNYDNEFDFAWDVRLVFANAMEYNMDNSELHINAWSLLMRFETLFSNWVLNVRDPHIHDLASGPWDDWMQLKYFDSSRDAVDTCRISGEVDSARNRLLFCESCEDCYSKKYAVDGEEVISESGVKLWRCKRCVDVVGLEDSLPDVKYRRHADEAELFRPDKKFGLGWNSSRSLFLSPLGYEFNSFAKAKAHILHEKQLNAKLLQERMIEFEDYKKSNSKQSTKKQSKRVVAASPAHSRRYAGSRGGAVATSSETKGQDDGDTESEAAKNLMLTGKLSTLDLTDSDIVWAGLAEEDAIRGGMFLGIFTPDNISPAGFSGLDDYTIHRSIEGMEGSVRCENYVYDNAESIVKSLKKVVDGVVERKTREHQIEALLQSKLTEERFYFRVLENSSRREMKGLLQSDHNYEAVSKYNRPFHTEVHSMLHPLLPADWDVAEDEFEALMYVWDYLHMSKTHSIAPTIGLMEMVKSILPGQINDFPTLACVLFDEVGVVLTDILLADLKRVLYGNNMLLWQDFLVSNPLNALTWPRIAYKLLNTLARLHCCKTLSSASALVSLSCSKNGDIQWYTELLTLIECYIMATVANHNTDGIPDTRAEVDVAVFSELAKDLQSGEMIYHDVGMFLVDVRDMIEAFLESNPMHTQLQEWTEAILVKYALDGVIPAAVTRLEMDIDGEMELGDDGNAAAGMLDALSDTQTPGSDGAHTEAAVGLEGVTQAIATNGGKGAASPEATTEADVADTSNVNSPAADDNVSGANDEAVQVVHGQIASVTTTLPRRQKAQEEVLRVAMLDNLSVALRVLPRKDPALFTAKEKLSVYCTLVQLGLMSSSMSATTIAIIKAAKANEAPTPELQPHVKARIEGMLEHVDVSGRGKAPQMKCHFTGVESKYVDDTGEWVYVPEQFLTHPVFPKESSAATIDEKHVTFDVRQHHDNDSDRNSDAAHAIEGHVEANKSEDGSDSLSLRIGRDLFLTAHTRRRTVKEDESGQRSVERAVCLKSVLMKIATAREAAVDEYDVTSRQVHIASICTTRASHSWLPLHSVVI